MFAVARSQAAPNREMGMRVGEGSAVRRAVRESLNERMRQLPEAFERFRS